MRQEVCTGSDHISGRVSVLKTNLGKYMLIIRSDAQFHAIFSTNLVSKLIKFEVFTYILFTNLVCKLIKF